MGNTLKGALIEYGSDFLGPIPNVVVFQFNPEKMSRTIEIPPRPVNATTRETSQAGEPPYERFTVEAQFSAADQRNSSDLIGLTMGVGPQLAALEAMVYPVQTPGGLIGAAVDAIGSLLSGSQTNSVLPIPRVQSPKILFVWGLMRIVPVIIESMTINEVQYDSLLNAEEASVTMGLAVISPCYCCDDQIAQGALQYTQLMQDTLATVNLANTVAEVVDLIPF
ncbi:MAG: hypothetical protein ABSH56_08805 [Bryobacteraceae bacterium]|jgi:hypothetical protein